MKPEFQARGQGPTPNPVLFWVIFLAMFMSGQVDLRAHLGSPNVFFEGQAGPYPVHIVIRPPPVIPGLAEISVHVKTNGVRHVRALPMRWNTGRQGAPPPDEALPVRGEPGLFSAQLWFMQGGAESVEVEVSGEAGTGKALIPVSAVATRVLTMPAALGWGLAGLGVLLILLLASIFGGAVREGVLAAGELPGRKRRWAARAVTGGAGLLLVGLAWLGKGWWQSEAADYRNNRVFQPYHINASVTAQPHRRLLRIELADEKFRRTSPLVPDHGKLMHLFLVRVPGMDVFAHLHPLKLDWRTFETRLPEMPPGSYDLYADVTYETGLADTLTARITVPAEAAAAGAIPDPTDKEGPGDPDDSWTAAGRAPELRTAQRSELTSGYAMEWLRDGPVEENRETRLRFVLRDREGKTRLPEPYMGMLGHLIVRRQDGSVFTHLHPGGSFSMAAQQLFAMRAEGTAPLRAAASTNDPICQLPSLQASQVLWLKQNPAGPDGAISFPYAFPKPGRYRLWPQVRINGEIQTGIFDVEVKAANPPPGA